MANSEQHRSKSSSQSAGCGSSIFFGLLTMVVLCYFGFKMLGSSYHGINEWMKLAALEDNLINQTPYEPPDDGLMSLEQVESFVYVQTEIKDAIEAEQDPAFKQWGEISRKLKDASPARRLRILLELDGSIFQTLNRAKSAQVAALNHEGISISEYHWLKQQAINALQVETVVLNIKTLVDNGNRGHSSESDLSKADIPMTAIVVHPDHAGMFHPHADLLEFTLLLSSLGV